MDAWEAAQLRRNPEYQRGAAWTPSQKQALIDSAFREYPLPPLFLEKLVSARRAVGGVCQICVQPVEQSDAEFDHFPIPHRDGGRTTLDNGRLVHKTCHPRGRPPAAGDEQE